MAEVVAILGALIQFIIGVTVMLMGFAYLIILFVSRLIHILLALIF